MPQAAWSNERERFNVVAGRSRATFDERSLQPVVMGPPTTHDGGQ